MKVDWNCLIMQFLSSILLGILHTGLGMTSVTALLSCMNIPGISSTSLKAREREVGVKVEKVAKETCDYFATKEKDLCE